jgi:hypothetical protein
VKIDICIFALALRFILVLLHDGMDGTGRLGLMDVMGLRWEQHMLSMNLLLLDLCHVLCA